jgi:anti-sigma regulatory factor (Ser/Thr protein kinase)
VSERLELEPVPSSIRSARLFVVDKLQEWRCDELVDRVALLTSELATNAVVHTGQPYAVSVSRRGPGVRVEVVDATSVLPQRHDIPEVAADEPSGGDATPGAPDGIDHVFSGLGIVDRTADAWGSEPVEGGKVVWFEVAAGPDEPPPKVTARSGLVDLREPGAPSPLAGDMDVSVDDWLVALDRSRIPAWVRVVLALVLLAAMLAVGLVLVD